MSTPTLRMLERQMQFRRQREEWLANRPPPTPEAKFRFARHRLRLDPAAARQFAGIEEPVPFMPPAAADESQPDWRAIAGSLMRNIEDLMLHQPRSAPRTREPDDVPVPAGATPTPTPAPPRLTMPQDFAFIRDKFGRTVAVEGAGRKFVVRHDRDGNFAGLDSDDVRVVVKRDHTGQVVGARREPKK